MLTRLQAVWLRYRSCLLIAAANLLQHKTRLCVALLGTAVPIVLLFLQISALGAARTQVTRLYDQFAFDLALVPAAYQFLVEAGTFDRVRFTQAKAIPEVAEIASLNIDVNFWTDEVSERRSPLVLIGLDDTREFVRDPTLRNELSLLTNSRSVLVDDFSSSDLGSLATGTSAMIGTQPVEIAGHFKLGLFFYADGSAIVRNLDFARLAERDARDTSIGLIKLVPGADPLTVRDRLVELLPGDVRLLTRAEFIAAERAFFISTKPIGLMLTISMWIAFLVGSVILLQVLSTDVVNRMGEFATLKAMGFSPAFVFGIGILEAAILVVGAFLPSLAMAALILWAIESTTHLPTSVTVSLVVIVFAIVLPMSFLAAATALRRIASAAPAELYR